MLDGRDGSALPTTEDRTCSAISIAACSRRDQVLQPVEMDGMRIGVLICYDVEFRRTSGAGRGRRRSGGGADGPDAALDFVARSLCRRAPTRTRSSWPTPTAAAARRDLDYLGAQLRRGPDGLDLARAGRGEELLIGRHRRRRMRERRRLNTYLADRRPELYARLVERGGKP